MVACAACGSRQVSEAAPVDAGAEVSPADAGGTDDGAAEAEAGLRQYPCKLSNDCEPYFGIAATCVGGFCCLGGDDGHGHCVCGTLDGGCQDPREGCCANPGQPLECHIDPCNL
jgi:hypothetical protein